MATSKILIDGVGIDLTSDTVTENKLAHGYTAHNSNGEKITGTLDPGGTPTLQQKSVTAPASGTTDVTPDSGYDGLSKVTVSPTPTETKSITANGTYTPTAGKHFSQVAVNVPAPEIRLQNKTVTENGNVTADSGYDGLGTVTVNVQGGSTVQTYTGTFSTNNEGEATVACGFLPDVVVIDFGTYVLEGYTYRSTLTFPLCVNPTNWYEVCAWGEPLGINMIDGEIGATSTSFSLWLHEITENWQFVHYANKGPFNVTAYKFL